MVHLVSHREGYGAKRTALHFGVLQPRGPSHAAVWSWLQPRHWGQGTLVSAGCHRPGPPCAAGADCSTSGLQLLYSVQQTARCDHTWARGMHAA